MSDNLSNTKYDELYNFATYLIEFKNLISKEVADSLDFFIGMDKYTFQTYMVKQHPNALSSNFYKQLYTDVIVHYNNRLEQLEKGITFYNIEYKGIDLYKRDTKNNKKGDFKKVIIKKTQTDLSTVLTYLARYGNENTMLYIENQLLSNDLTNSKREYYETIVRLVNKFTFERLFRLTKSRKDRIISKYNKPIVYKKIMIKGRSRKTNNIISFNRNYNSCIDAFINISWIENGSTMTIPVKYSKSYHGDMKDYLKKDPCYEYTITFTEDKQVKVNICKSGTRDIPENKTNFVGIDVNMKHNMLALSDGDTIDYDRKLINKLSTILKRTDELKQNKDYKIGKKNQKTINSLTNKIQKDIEYKFSMLCKSLNMKGLDHIVMEDLQKTFGRTKIKTEDDLNYNRLQSILRLNSLKDIMVHIAMKYDICVSTVHPEYTSQTCPVCGCINELNRPNQETFCCIDCGHKNNADINAAENIKNRAVSTVLRNKLLKLNKLDNGSFEPKIMPRAKVKEILLSCS